MVERAPGLRALNVHTCFLVEDVLASAEFYRDVLGFLFERTWGNPPRFALVERGSIEVLFTEGRDTGPFRTGEIDATVAGWDAYFRVADVAALSRDLAARGAEILRGPAVSFYGMHEVHVRDCNGFVLCFAEESDT